MSEGLQGLLCFTGVLLFALGLLTGFAIPALRSPRIGLSAHVAAIQSGLALVAVGLVGSRLALSEAWAAAIAHTLWISLYVLWLGLVFAGVFGTGRTLPIAGGALRAKPWQEATALVLIGGASLGTAAAFAALLAEWSWRG
jgi:(hydroxyamino)benzene mutase